MPKIDIIIFPRGSFSTVKTIFIIFLPRLYTPATDGPKKDIKKVSIVNDIYSKTLSPAIHLLKLKILNENLLFGSENPTGFKKT